MFIDTVRIYRRFVCRGMSAISSQMGRASCTGGGAEGAGEGIL
jgi:hypothetical protein